MGNDEWKQYKIYVASVFLYKSELWILTEKLKSTIDTTQTSKKNPRNKMEVEHHQRTSLCQNKV